MKHDGNILYLPKKRIVIGMGTKRGIPKNVLRTEVETALAERHLHISSVCALACIKNRYNEMGICMLANELGIPIFSYGMDELENIHEHTSVCNRATVAACREISEFYRFLFKKRIENGIIISVAVIWR